MCMCYTYQQQSFFSEDRNHDINLVTSQELFHHNVRVHEYEYVCVFVLVGVYLCGVLLLFHK